MVFKRHYLLLLLFSCCFFGCKPNTGKSKKVTSQIPPNISFRVSFEYFSSTVFDANIITANEKRSIRFEQYRDDKPFNRFSANGYDFLDYSFTSSLSKKPISLSEETKYIKAILDAVKQKYKLTLRSFYFPFTCKEILDKYVTIFENTSQLKTFRYTKKGQIYPYHDIVIKQLGESNVFQSWNNLLNHYGYYLAGFRVGEHSNARYSKEFLKEMGYDTTLILPRIEVYWQNIEEIKEPVK